MIADIEAGKVTAVLVKDMSRVGRSHLETGYYTDIYFAKMDIRFIAIGNHVDNSIPETMNFNGIMNIMNEWNLKDTSRKVRASAQLKGKSGKPLSVNPCFGYRKDPEDKNHWIVDEEAAEIVRNIYDMAASGMSQGMICRTLSKEKRITPGCYRMMKHGKTIFPEQANRWNRNMIHKIIERREYLGETVNFKTSKPSYREKQIINPPEQQMRFPDAHEAIVSVELWERAQQVLHPEMCKHEKRKRDVLADMIVCSDCGKAMVYRHRENEKRTDCFICRTYVNSRDYEHRVCSPNSIKVSDVRALITETICSISRYAITDQERFRRSLEKRLEKNEEHSALKKQLQKTEKRIAELEFLIQKLYENVALSRISEECFDILSEQYEHEQQALKEKISSLRKIYDEHKALDQQANHFMEIVKKYWTCESVTDEMIRAFVEKVVVHPKTKNVEGEETRAIEIDLKFIGPADIPTNQK